MDLLQLEPKVALSSDYLVRLFLLVELYKEVHFHLSGEFGAFLLSTLAEKPNSKFYTDLIFLAIQSRNFEFHSPTILRSYSGSTFIQASS